MSLFNREFRVLHVFYALSIGLVLSACGGGSTSGSSTDPIAPSDPKAAGGNQTLTISWVGNSANSEYHVYCDVDSSKPNTSRTYTFSTPNNTHTFTNLVNGATYYCNITAVRGGKESDPVSVTGIPTGTGTTLTAPTNVQASAGNGEINVTWSPVTGATKYTVYYSMNTGVTKASTTKQDATSANAKITGLMNMTYYVVVTASNGTQESVESAQVTVTPSANTLLIPTNVTATAGDGKISVAWSTVNGATGYKIYYSENGSVSKPTSPFAPISVSGGATATTEITGLTNGKIYYVTVTATNSTTESSESEKKSATPSTGSPALVAPTNVTVTPGNGQLSVEWNSVTGASSYKIHYSTTSGVTKANSTKQQLVAASTATKVSATIPGLTNNTAYYLVVTTIIGTQESAESSERNGTPSATPTPVSTSAQRGARLYDDFLKETNNTIPVYDNHVIWQTRAKDSNNEYYNNETSTYDTWRCITCHGGDYQGKDGYANQTARPSQYTGFPGVAGTTKTAEQIDAFIREGRTANGTLHRFFSLSLLNATDIADLTAFITTIAKVQKPNMSTLMSGDAQAGEKAFFTEGKNSANNTIPACASCHSGMMSIENIATKARKNPFEFLHRTQFGRPGGTGSEIELLSQNQAAGITNYLSAVLANSYDGTKFYDRTKHKSYVQKGRELYLDWTTSTTLTPKVLPAADQIQPRWAADSKPVPASRIDTWKCVTCHGTDLRGTPATVNYRGLLRERTSTTTFPYYQTEKDMFEFVKNSLRIHSGNSKHAFGYFLSEDDLYALSQYIWTERNKIGLGGRLYDSWVKEKAGDPTVVSINYMNPAWANYGGASKTLPYPETWSCASCHGWDFKGDYWTGEFNNAYNYCFVNPTLPCNFPYRTGILGILHPYYDQTSATWRWSLKTQDRNTLINTLKSHAFGPTNKVLADYFSDYEVEVMADFILDPVNGVRNYDLLLAGTNGASIFYNSTNDCNVCHNSTTTPSLASLVGLAKNSRAKTIHRSRFGVSGSTMLPTTNSFIGLTPQEGANVHQFLFTQ